MASEYLTAHSRAEVSDLERRWKEQGYLPFHRIQPNGTWRVFKGKLSSVNPNLIENMSEEQITRELFRQTYVPREKPKAKEEPEIKETVKEPDKKYTKSGDQFVITTRPYSSDKDAERAASRAKLLGVEAQANDDRTVVLRGDSEDKLREVSEKMNMPPTKEEQEQIWKMQAEEKKKKRGIEEELSRETSEEILKRLRTKAEERGIEKKFEKELAEKGKREEVYEITLAKISAKKFGTEKEAIEHAKKLSKYGIHAFAKRDKDGMWGTELEVGFTIPKEDVRVFAKGAKGAIDTAGSDIKGTLSAYSKSRSQRLSDEEIKKGIKSGIQSQTRVIKSSGKPKIGAVGTGQHLKMSGYKESEIIGEKAPKMSQVIDISALQSTSGGVKDKGFANVKQHSRNKGFADMNLEKLR